MDFDKIGYGSCRLCPHACAVDRSKGGLGVCGEGTTMRVAWIGLHRGEEPPLVGEKGSGTIFFTGCPLHCRYCQNRQISMRNSESGVPVTVEQFASLLMDLQAFGAANANLVTGTHFIPSIIQALELARQKGFSLPVVWNSSGFESVDALQMIDPHIDTYLIDLKTLDRCVAHTFCGSANYIDHIEKVIGFLVARHPTTRMEQGVLRGILVRHLLFPGTGKASEDVLRWFASHAKHAAWLSLMVQFVPPKGMEASLPEITEEAYDRLLEILDELGIEDGFVQELADNIPWIPDFERDNPFPQSFAEPLPEFLQLKHRLLNR